MILALALLLLSPTARAAEPVVDEFHAAFVRAEEKIARELPELAVELAPLRLHDVAKQATVEGTDEILVVEAADGSQESVAVNEPAARRVLVNRARWANVASDLVKEAVALHEILSLAGAERTGAYPLSARYLEKFGGRTDAAYLTAGREPGAPSWKNLRVSCEKRFEYVDLPTGRVQKDSSFSLAALAKWKIRGKEYALQWNFGTEVEKLQTLTPLSLSVTEKIKSDGAGEVLRTQESVITRSINDYLYYEKPAAEYVEERTGKSALRYYWEKNRRGKLRERDSIEELTDGSLRLLSDNLVPHTDKNVKTFVSRTECVLKRMPEGEWIAVTGEPGLVAAFDTLNDLAKNANEAVVRPGYVSGTVSPEEKAFLAAWDALYRAQIKKVDAVRYRPEKGVKGSILAAGRRPKPVPKEIRDATLKETMADMARLRKQGKPYPYATKAPAAAPKRLAARPAPRRCGIATKPTFIRAPDGGSPILRDVGQSLCLDGNALAGFKALQEYKKRSQRYD